MSNTITIEGRYEYELLEFDDYYRTKHFDFVTTINKKLKQDEIRKETSVVVNGQYYYPIREFLGLHEEYETGISETLEEIFYDNETELSAKDYEEMLAHLIEEIEETQYLLRDFQQPIKGTLADEFHDRDMLEAYPSEALKELYRRCAHLRFDKLDYFEDGSRDRFEFEDGSAIVVHTWNSNPDVEWSTGIHRKYEQKAKQAGEDYALPWEFWMHGVEDQIRENNLYSR